MSEIFGMSRNGNQQTSLESDVRAGSGNNEWLTSDLDYRKIRFIATNFAFLEKYEIDKFNL